MSLSTQFAPKFGTVLLQHFSHDQFSTPSQERFSITYTDDGQDEFWYKKNLGLAVQIPMKTSVSFPIRNPDPSGNLVKEKRYENIARVMSLLAGNLPDAKQLEPSRLNLQLALTQTAQKLWAMVREGTEPLSLVSYKDKGKFGEAIISLINE